VQRRVPRPRLLGRFLVGINACDLVGIERLERDGRRVRHDLAAATATASSRESEHHQK